MDPRDVFESILPGDPLAIDHYSKVERDPRDCAQVFPPDAIPFPTVDQPAPAEKGARSPEPYGESAHYREHSFRWRARDLNALAPGYDVIEIARWHCPNGHVGIISSIATHLGLSILLAEGDTPIPQTLEIGLNLPWQPWLYTVLGVPFRWWLRLESQRENVELYPVALRGVGELPGQPFPELSTWNDLRFGWEYHGREPIRLIVPEGHTVRLFVGLDSQAFDPRSSSLVAKASKKTAQLSASLPARSDFWIDPTTPEAQQAIAVASQGAIEPETLAALATSSATRTTDVKAVVRPDDNGLTVAGRLIGTIQTYRVSRNATEAVRRGL